MATIMTGSHPKALWPGVAAWWGAKYDEHDVQYTAIFDVKNSTRNYEEDVQTSGFGLLPEKDEGSGTKYDSHSQGYVSRYVHVAYALGYICTKEEIDDNLYAEVSMSRAESLAYSCRQTEENVGANVLNNGFDANYTGGDGTELFSTSHSDFHGTWSNHLTTAADFSESSAEDLCIQIMNALNPRGLKMNIKPKRLIIPTALVFDVERVLKSQNQSGSANNDVNALRTRGAIPEVAVNNYLTDTDAWFVKTTAPRGLIWYDRAMAEFTHDGDFDTENDKSKVYRRFSVGWTDPRGAYASPGA